MSNNNANNTTQKTITLNGLFTTALRHWRILVSLIVVCFVLTVIYSAFIVTPMYTSTAKLYIINKVSSSNQITSTDFNISTYLTNDFKEILSDEVILSEVAEELNNKYSCETLQSFLDIKAPESTRIIEIKVTSPNAKDSKKIADSICRISEEKLPEILGLDHVKIIRNGSLAKNPTSPNVSADAFKGLIAGIILATALAFLIMLTDNKITSSDDVEKILGISVLTTIPYNDHRMSKRGKVSR